MNKVKGRVRKFGDQINTDIITPASTLQLPMEELKKHSFKPIYPESYKIIKEGDVIVAGKKFGCGSRRGQTTAAVKALGIHFIACESIARIYFRNCIGLGIYAIFSKRISEAFDEGDEIEIDLEKGRVRNSKTGKAVSLEPLPGTPLGIFD